MTDPHEAPAPPGAPPAASPPGAAPPPPALPGPARARIAARAVTELFVLTAGAVGLAVWLLGRGQGPLALGLAIGHGTGLLIATTWVVATAATWTGRKELLLRFTLGLWPVRMLVFVIGALASNAAGASGGAFLFALVGTHVWGTIVEARTLSALTRGETPR